MKKSPDIPITHLLFYMGWSVYLLISRASSTNDDNDFGYDDNSKRCWYHLNETVALSIGDIVDDGWYSR